MRLTQVDRWQLELTNRRQLKSYVEVCGVSRERESKSIQSVARERVGW